MYYIYYIPGKKIGVTRNLNHRVTLMQGYKETEYELHHPKRIPGSKETS